MSEIISLERNSKRNSEFINKFHNSWDFKLGTACKKVFFLLVSTFIVSLVLAAPVSENVARNVANKVLQNLQTTQNAGLTNQKAVSTSNLQLLYVSSSYSESFSNSMQKNASKETVYFYVFGTENNDGFVIVSADDRVVPILGYSDENGFAAENLPENLKWWLSEYARQIQFAIDNNIEATPEVAQKWAEYLGTNNNGKEE